MSSIRHGKLPGPEDRDRNNPMAAAVVVAGWGQVRGRACLQIMGGGWKQPATGLGTWRVRVERPSHLQLWLDEHYSCPGSFL